MIRGSKQLFFTIAGIAALLCVVLFLYSFWQQIIQTDGATPKYWSGVFAFVAGCSFVLGLIWRR